MASGDLEMQNSGLVSFSKTGSEKFIAKEYHSQFTSRLVTLREYARLTDVTLKCQDQKLTCHRVVLAAASSYFHAMFCSTGFEENKQEVVELKTCSPDILSIIVDFIYTAEAELSTDNVQSICSACDELGLLELKEGCDVFMSQRVEPANCLGLYMFAKHCNLTHTLKESKDCMSQNLKYILEQADDSELKIFGEEELLQYISDDELGAEDEALVFELVAKWIRVDPLTRKNSIEKVMQHIRFPFCSYQKLWFDIKSSPLMQSTSCKDLLLEVLAYHIVPDQRGAILGNRAKPRKCIAQLVLLDGSNAARGKCWYYDKQKAQWKDFSNLQTAGLCYFKACICGNDIVVTGGSTVNTVWAYCLLTQSWRPLPSMTVTRYHHSVVCVGEELYAIGGYCNNAISNHVEKLDAKRQRWTQIASMNQQLYQHLGVRFDQNIFVMGGLNIRSQSSLTTLMFDTKTGQWMAKRNMPQPCNQGSAVVLNQRIYVVGDANKCCMSYDPSQDAWTMHTKPLQARNHCAATIWMGKIVLCGGGRKDIEEYDPEKDQWTTWQVSLPAALNYHTVLTVNTRM